MDFMLQAREKFMSLRKSTKFDVAAVIEEVHQVAHLWYCIDKHFIILSWTTMIFFNLI